MNCIKLAGSRFEDGTVTCNQACSIVTKLKEASEVMIHSIVLYMNLRKKLWLLLRSFFNWLRLAIQNWLNEVDFALA